MSVLTRKNKNKVSLSFNSTDTFSQHNSCNNGTKVTISEQKRKKIGTEARGWSYNEPPAESLVGT